MMMQGRELAKVVGVSSQKQEAITSVVVQAWNMMGGLEWHALPTVMDILDVQDVESVVEGLIEVRDWLRQTEDMED